MYVTHVLFVQPLLALERIIDGLQSINSDCGEGPDFRQRSNSAQKPVELTAYPEKMKKESDRKMKKRR